MVGRLKAERFLDSAPDRRLTPGRRFFERPFVEAPVRAGAPNSGDDPEIGSLDVNDYLVRNPAATFLVPVKGDSMIDAGIRDGDIVVVEKTRSANDGQIVVASVGGDVTVKRLRFERGKPVLQPENRSHSAIHPTGEFSVLGIVVGLVRRYT
jgi:repressor LexA